MLLLATLLALTTPAPRRVAVLPAQWSSSVPSINLDAKGGGTRSAEHLPAPTAAMRAFDDSVKLYLTRLPEKVIDEERVAGALRLRNWQDRDYAGFSCSEVEQLARDLGVDEIILPTWMEYSGEIVRVTYYVPGTIEEPATKFKLPPPVEGDFAYDDPEVKFYARVVIWRSGPAQLWKHSGEYASTGMGDFPKWHGKATLPMVQNDAAWKLMKKALHDYGSWVRSHGSATDLSSRPSRGS